MSTPNKYYLLPAKLCCCSEHRDSCFNVDESTLPDGADKNVTITDIEMCFCSTDRCSHTPCKHQSSPLSACKYASSSQISTRSDMMSPRLIGPIYREVCRTFDSLTWSHIGDLWLYKGTKYSFLSAVCCFLLVWGCCAAGATRRTPCCPSPPASPGAELEASRPRQLASSSPCWSRTWLEF